MNLNRDPKGSILKFITKHPEGLAILEIAELTKMNRITVSKYVSVLTAEGLLVERKIGSAKLYYLKRMKR